MTPNTKTYVAAEPDRVEAFADQRGNLHSTRDEAIDANFDEDWRQAVNATLQAFPDMPVINFRQALGSFILTNPDLVRVMIGDRDKT